MAATLEEEDFKISANRDDPRPNPQSAMSSVVLAEEEIRPPSPSLRRVNNPQFPHPLGQNRNQNRRGDCWTMSRHNSSIVTACGSSNRRHSASVNKKTKHTAMKKILKRLHSIPSQAP